MKNMLEEERKILSSPRLFLEDFSKRMDILRKLIEIDGREPIGQNEGIDSQTQILTEAHMWLYQNELRPSLLTLKNFPTDRFDFPERSPLREALDDCLFYFMAHEREFFPPPREKEKDVIICQDRIYDLLPDRDELNRYMEEKLKEEHCWNAGHILPPEQTKGLVLTPRDFLWMLDALREKTTGRANDVLQIVFSYCQKEFELIGSMKLLEPAALKQRLEDLSAAVWKRLNVSITDNNALLLDNLSETLLSIAHNIAFRESNFPDVPEELVESRILHAKIAAESHYEGEICYAHIARAVISDEQKQYIRERFRLPPELNIFAKLTRPNPLSDTRVLYALTGDEKKTMERLQWYDTPKTDVLDIMDCPLQSRPHHDFFTLTSLSTEKETEGPSPC